MDTSKFLQTSQLATQVRLPTRIVMRRGQLSPTDVVAIKTDGTYDAATAGAPLCELVVGGTILARGRVIRRGGRVFFKVAELGEES